jgi:chromate transporter
VKATRNELEFTALLTALSAAVGVIVKLAVFFVWHVFWPKATAAQPLAR